MGPRRGYAHTFAFAGRPSSRRAAPVTLLGLDAARCPGPAQFAPALVARELTKAHAGFAALARSGAGCCETGLWGCEGAHISPGTFRSCAARRPRPDGHTPPPRRHTPPLRARPVRPSLTRRRHPQPPSRAGFSGGQPVLRMLLQLLAAARAGVRLRLELPSDTAPKWYAGVLAELRAHPPTAAALHALLCNELPQQRARLSQDVPAYASFFIKALRKAASASATTSTAASAAGTSAAAATTSTTTADEGPDATVPLKRVRTQSLCPDEFVPSRQRQGEQGEEM